LSDNAQANHHPDDHLIKVSKFLSYVLRHRPDAIGLALDTEGWASISELIDKAKSQMTLTDDLIQEVVSTNDKQRFSISDDGRRIRASQGHSVDVDLGLEPLQPPRFLYHGTAERFLPSIIKEGLRAGQRQYVHLSVDIETAITVGKRYGRPVVLEVASEEMHSNGLDFYRSGNGVWLTHHVPVKFLRESYSINSTDSHKTSRHPKLST
jgi:putative RNA 2'-phosphotransferase